MAYQLQQLAGSLLLQIAASIRHQFGGSNLCLGGGLFYNSYFTTLLAESALYAEDSSRRTRAMQASPSAPRWPSPPPSPLTGASPLSPFLGPEFSPQQIKATLDNCKLSYDYLHDGQVIERTATALGKGPARRLVPRTDGVGCTRRSAIAASWQVPSRRTCSKT